MTFVRHRRVSRDFQPPTSHCGVTREGVDGSKLLSKLIVLRHLTRVRKITVNINIEIKVLS